MRGLGSSESRSVEVIAQRWNDLSAQADQLSDLADLASASDQSEFADFVTRISAAACWQRTLAWQGIEDIEAMLHPGLTALRTIEERGQSAQAPALALWREVHSARKAIVEMVASSQISLPVEAA